MRCWRSWLAWRDPPGRRWRRSLDLARDVEPLRQLYFGYTQTALRDLQSDSVPFRGPSYRPSLFYRNDARWTSPGKGIRPGLSSGIEDESNGRDGLSSRSINSAFVRPMLRLGDPGGSRRRRL